MKRIPQDPMLCLSFVNTWLRDQGCDLEELCASLAISREELEEKLLAIGYGYDREQNRFR